ncbi:hypothetical protein DFS34DRAFT_135973 [Phlyctochytrium arcticum]|nr:hypothetical protein DFS34DRAFT_135973 [Phlyctochytrium arcticum]
MVNQQDETVLLRAKATNDAYNVYVTQFKEYCLQKKFWDFDTVRLEKIVGWLAEDMIPRGRVIDRKPFSRSAVEMMIKSCVDYYVRQQNLGRNPNPHPRNNNNMLRNIISGVRKKANRQRIKDNIDHGIGTIIDGYSGEEKFGLRNTWFDGELEKDKKRKRPGLGLRNRACFLMGNATMMRSQGLIKLQLADMWTREYKHEGHTVCHVVGITS